MDADFKLIQDLVKCLAGVDVKRAGMTDEEIVDAFFEGAHATLRSAVSDREVIRMFRNMRPDCIYEVKVFLNVSYLCIRSGRGEGCLVIGPCRMEPMSEFETMLQLQHSKFEPEIQKVLEDHIRKLPIVPHETFHQLGVLLANHLNGIPRPVPYQQIDYHWGFASQESIILVDHYEDLEQMRRVELRYETSTALTEAVKQGNLSLAYQLLRHIDPELSKPVRNPNPLRNTQNTCIILNAQMRYAMEESGIHPYRLDQFSNEIALKIEKLRTFEEASEYPLEIIRRYCELAQENAYPNLKPFSRLAVTYIKEHLSDNLTVKGTAKALMVNANYLSYQFHQDLGMTFIDFVNRERINQAAALLKHTNMQIQQIAAAVGYNNTSYFAKQFVKYQQMTPRSFRMNGVL